MNLGEFHILVKNTANRGSTLDSKIPVQTKLAVQWIERNYTFKYMEKFRLLQMVPPDRTILLETSLIKAHRFIRFIGTDGQFSYVRKIKPEDVTQLPTIDATSGLPAGYWTVANKLLVFSATPTAQLNGEAMWYEYTDWPVKDESTHTLLDIAADLLLCQTLLHLAAFVMRDMRMATIWKELRTEAVNTLTRAEDELEHSGESVSMAYGPQSVR